MTRILGLSTTIFAIVFLACPFLTWALDWVDYNFVKGEDLGIVAPWRQDEIEASLIQFFTSFEHGKREDVLSQLHPNAKMFVLESDLVGQAQIGKFMNKHLDKGYTYQTVINKLTWHHSWATEAEVEIEGHMNCYWEEEQVRNIPLHLIVTLARNEGAIKIRKLLETDSRLVFEDSESD
ncbi:uncharacterized protein MELLADRAFT_124123 [Melampsora larici-populina 98AG31]|uniref:Secreted protein n=1 Tax=Melampsora larici-populina (strain 98AG31 / pathotype 3-4-7) TaxID=747676 RepID=F4RP62_MELLP|nr:uncharacterized protein MELLADRAFT_124123 [Melampsora larici-populina 98AG31]EGG05761.1 secreted protein [Melampsora larici-populina 98AG31]